jgi:hypothetical protein
MRLAVWLFAIVVLGLAVFLILDQWWPRGRGGLVVISDPPGAQVWLNLNPTAITANGKRSVLPAGRYSVMVRLDTLEPDPVAQVVDILPGRTDTVRFRLLPPEIRRQETAAAASRKSPVPTSTQPVGRKSPARESAAPTRTRADSSRSSARSEPLTDKGRIEVSSTVLGARILLDGKPRSEITPATIELPLGTYEVQVKQEGYRVDPEEQTVRVTRGRAPQLVFFTMQETAAQDHEFTVETSPVSGRIFVDSAAVGEGRVAVARDYGVYQISFGEVSGWRMPEPVRFNFTPGMAKPEVKGVYTPTFRVAAQAEGADKAVTEGDVRWNVGVYFEGEGAQISAALGARIRAVPSSQKFGWELAVGDPTRNPTGSDYVEFFFTLPPEVPPSTPMTLRLYIYRSERKFPFTVSGTSEVVVSVNGRVFLDGLRPTYVTDAADAGHFQEWPLQGILVAGQNRIMVRGSEKNNVYNYLWRIEIL